MSGVRGDVAVVAAYLSPTTDIRGLGGTLFATNLADSWSLARPFGCFKHTNNYKQHNTLINNSIFIYIIYTVFNNFQSINTETFLVNILAYTHFFIHIYIYMPKLK